MSDIAEALELLDAQDDDHWTSDGLPSVDAVKGLLGEDVTRAQISEAAPDFKRPAPDEAAPDPAPADDAPEWASVEAELAECEAKKADMRKQLAELKSDYEALDAQSEHLGRQLDAMKPVETYADQVRKQHQASIQAIEQRHEAAQKAMAALAGAGVVSAASPLDAAIAAENSKTPVPLKRG